LFSETVLSYKTVFGHFRKWRKKGKREQTWIHILSNHKKVLGLFGGNIDGSHCPTSRGGQEVAYQGRKNSKTTNILYFTGRQGIPLSMFNPVAGNHHDLYKIEGRLKELFSTMERAKIDPDGLFINADSGFDSKEFRNTCNNYGIFSNVNFNVRNGNVENDYPFEELTYNERYSIERTNAWMDSSSSLLNRFAKTTSCWKAFNYTAFIVILLKKVKLNKKS
jgi:hypothetical protein